jgi:undecaprenyl diphosphate synthase
MTIKDQINPDKLPLHIAIIMDGNGRWARQKGKLRIFGHQNAVKAVRETVEAAAEIGIKYLTLYAFSTENWSRPKAEVNALMELLVHSINTETETLNKNDIKLLAIGDLESLPDNCHRELKEAIQATANNKRMSLVIAISYSSKWEITEAVKKIGQDVKDGKLKAEDINEQAITDRLATAGIPDPELMIRTSGESRISNFLLWQLAYSEFYFTPTLWPDFRKNNLYEAIISYQQRERRFGLTSEQVQ